MRLKTGDEAICTRGPLAGVSGTVTDKSTREDIAVKTEGGVTFKSARASWTRKIAGLSLKKERAKAVEKGIVPAEEPTVRLHPAMARNVTTIEQLVDVLEEHGCPVAFDGAST